MKPTLLMLMLAFAFASCTQYQYLTVSGINVPKTERNELVSENDTLRVAYHFAQEKGQVSIRVFNKTNEPLEIEWRKSAIIINDQTIGYYDASQKFTGQVESDSWRYLRRTLASGDVKGEIQSSEQVQFIPPQSYVESRPVAIPLSPLANFPEEKAEKTSFRIGTDNTINYKRLPFQAENSPTRFRSYLTLRIGRGAAQQEFSVEHQFFVSEIWKSSTGPEFFASMIDNRGDRFYLSQ